MEYISTKSGLLPKLGLGTYSIPIGLLPELISAALDMGYTLFDTANKYQNEEIIGDILSNARYSRKGYLIETKVQSELLLGNLRYLRLNRLSPKSALKNACKNLKTNYIDVFMIHSVFTGYEKYLKEFISLKHHGVIKYVGLCNVNLNQLKTLESKGLLPDIAQVEMHPYFSNKSLLEFCHLHNIVIEARSPFAHGDAMNDWLNEPILQNIAIAHQSTVHQIILRWITQQNVIGLPRTSNIEHLKENMKSFDIILSEDEIRAIDSLNKNKSYGYVSSRNYVK